MKSLFIAVTVSIFALAAPAQAADYSGNWDFNLKVVKTSCSGVSVGDPKTFAMSVQQQRRVITASIVITGVGGQFVGYTNSSGLIISQQSSCIVVPGGECSTGSESAVFEKPKGKSKNMAVVWVSISRNSASQFDCATTYTGKARRK